MRTRFAPAPASGRAAAAGIKGTMAARQQPDGLVKLVLELGPLVTFFVVNFRAESLGFGRLPGFSGLEPAILPMMASTAAFMLATVISLAVSLALYGRLPVMPLVSGVVVVLFGAATLYLRDQTFIQLKPTIVNLLFAATLFGGLLFRKPLMSIVLGSVLQLDDAGWRKLSLRWALFFVVLAGLNEVVWRNFSYDTWVTFKVFGTLPLTLVFTLFQVPLLRRHEVKPGEVPAAPN